MYNSEIKLLLLGVEANNLLDDKARWMISICDDVDDEHDYEVDEGDNDEQRS